MKMEQHIWRKQDGRAYKTNILQPLEIKFFSFIIISEEQKILVIIYLLFTCLFSLLFQIVYPEHGDTAWTETFKKKNRATVNPNKPPRHCLN